MKKSMLIVAVLAAAMCGGKALAQGGVGPVKGTDPSSVKSSNKDMHQAIKLAHQAHQLIKSALPIYKGQREDALKEIHAGVIELQEALKAEKGKPAEPGDKKGKNGGLGKGHGAGKGVGNDKKGTDSKTTYTPAQIAESDKKISDGTALLDQAIKLLDNADPIYHGERMDAIAKFKEAQKHLGKALTIK